MKACCRSLMLVSLALSAVGCVAQADYDQLMVQNRSLAAEKEAAMRRALDAEAQTESLRDQIRNKEGELEVQRQLVASLREENEHLESAFRRAQELMAKMDFSPDRPVIIENVLPQELDSALKDFASAYPDAVEYDPSRGVVKWKSDLLFPSGSDVIREDAKSSLRSFTKIISMAEAREFDVVVVGHTDSDPIVHAKAKGHPTNWHLSAHRGIAVGMELLQSGFDPDRLGIMGYSEYRPVAANETTEGKSQNRRVEIYLVSQGSIGSTRTARLETPKTQSTAQPAPQK